MDFTAETRLVALLGDPVSHSLSPMIHNVAFRALDLDLAYVAIHVKSEYLGNAVRALQVLGFEGANLTIPHKEAVIPHLDDLTKEARTIGAVNTILFDRTDGQKAPRLIGDNTDAAGFLDPLNRYRERLIGATVLVWGNGGAARSVVYAALTELQAGQVVVVSRSEEKGNALRDSFKDLESENVSVIPWGETNFAQPQADLLVNATPLGTTPDIDASPCFFPELLHADQIVYDLVYNPAETKLLNQAAEAGCDCIGGLDMLIGQAAVSFRAWTGLEMPVDFVRSALQKALRP